MGIELKQLRKSKKITQVEAASFLEVPYRTYQSYEEDPKKQNSIKYKYMIDKLSKYGVITENFGVYKIDSIKAISKPILKDYETDFAFIAGEYAKNKAKGSSTITIIISTKASGLRFFKLSNDLKEALKKRINLVSVSNLKNDEKLLIETLLYGVRIF
ncbi:MAG: helix-turn-helix transcriptional regulator [Bacilli bacterium]|nr:helix-turn-helix transcriptional regulator [Bacilli bacterium]